MRIAIFGAGAIGLDLAANLIRAGHDVGIVARNQTLAALRQNGIQHYDKDDALHAAPPDAFRVSDKPETLGRHDAVFVTVKSDALPNILENIPCLLDTNGFAVFAINGVPPWYSIGHPGVSRHLTNTRTRDSLLRHMAAEQIMGMVVNRNVSSKEPGIVRHNAGDGYKIGEIDHAISSRVKNLAAVLEGAGFSAAISDNIHRDVWHKLLINASINPLTVITGQAIGPMLDNPESFALAKQAMEEIHDLGVKLEVVKKGDFDFDGFLQKFRTQRYDSYTSMYSDFVAGRPLERERIMDVVLYLSQLKTVAVELPNLQKIARELETKAPGHRPQFRPGLVENVDTRAGS